MTTILVADPLENKKRQVEKEDKANAKEDKNFIQREQKTEVKT
jgi:hypothetical protein